MSGWNNWTPNPHLSQVAASSNGWGGNQNKWNSGTPGMTQREYDALKERDKLAAELSDAQEKVTLFQRTSQKLSGDNATLRKAADTYTEVANELKSMLEKETRELNRQLDDSRSELATLKTQLQRAQGAADDASNRLSKASIMITRKEEEIEVLKAQLESVMKENAELKKLSEKQQENENPPPTPQPPVDARRSRSPSTLPTTNAQPQSQPTSSDQRSSTPNVNGPPSRPHSGSSLNSLELRTDIARLNQIITTKSQAITSLESEVETLRDQRAAFEADRDSRIRDLSHTLDVVKRGKRKAEDDFLEEREAKRRARDDLEKEVERREDAEKDLAFEKRERNRLLDQMEGLEKDFDSEVVTRKRLEEDLVHLKQSSAKLATKIHCEWRERLKVVEEKHHATVKEKWDIEEKLKLRQEADKAEAEKFGVIQNAISNIRDIVDGVLHTSVPVPMAPPRAGSVYEGPPKPNLIDRFAS